jgi:hypothetical protein
MDSGSIMGINSPIPDWPRQRPGEKFWPTVTVHRLNVVSSLLGKLRCRTELAAFEESEEEDEKQRKPTKIPEVTPFCDFCVLMEMLYGKFPGSIPEPDNTYWRCHLKIAHGLEC